MEVDLQGAQPRLLNTASLRQSVVPSCYQQHQQQQQSQSSQQVATMTPSPELPSQSRQKTLSKASSFDASSTTLTTVDALLNTTFDRNAHDETPERSTSESRSRKASAPRKASSRSESHKPTISYAQYLLQPACEFQDEISGELFAASSLVRLNRARIR